MPIYSPTGFLDITNATLRTSNVEAENLLMTGGNIYVTSELETDATVLNLENVTRKGNVSSNTIEITNATTGIVATGNVQASKFIGSGEYLTGIPPSAITGTLSQWSDGTNGDVYIAGGVGIANAHTLTSNTLQVGGNLYVRDTGSNVLTVDGNVVANYFEGDGSKLSGIVTDLQGVTDNGNTTTNVVQFSNVTTGLVTTANIEVGGDLKIDGLTAGKIPYVAADKFLKDSFITTTGDTTVITSNLDVTGNIFMRGDKFIVHSESKLINDAIVGIANNNTVSTTDKGIIMQNTAGNVAIIHHGTGDGFADQLTFGYTDDPLDTVTVTNDLTKELTVNVLGNVITQNNLSIGGLLKINTISAASSHSLEAVTNLGNVTSNTVQFSNAITSLVASSNVVVTGNVSAGHDTNTTSFLGRAAVGYMGQDDQASFAHVDHNDPARYAIKQTAAGPTYINTPAAGHIRFTVNDGNAGAEKMRITSAGKVGVGVTSPDATLHVVGNAYVSSNLTVSGNVEVGTANLFVDTINSRVGVNTSAPGSALDVVGDVEISSNLVVNGTSHLSNIASTDYSKQFTQSYFVDFDGITATNEELSLFQFEPNIDEFTIIQGEVIVDILSKRAQTFMHYQSQKLKIKFNFSWDARGGTGSWRITDIFVDRMKSSANGVDKISYPVEVKYKYKGDRSANPDIPPKVQVYLMYNGNNFEGRFNVNGVYHSNALDYGLSFPSTVFTNDGDTTDTSVDTQMVHDIINGNVGIGTDNPIGKLDVRGAIMTPVVPFAHNQDAPYLITGTSGYTGAATNWNTHGFQHRIKTNSGGVPRITVDTANAGEAFSIVNDGNVGIGTTSPENILHLADADTDLMYLQKTTNTGGVGIKFTDTTSANQFGYLRYYHADSESFGNGNCFRFSSSETTETLALGGALHIGVDGKDAGDGGNHRKNLFIQSTYGGNTSQNYGWWMGAQDQNLTATDNDFYFSVVRNGTIKECAAIIDQHSSTMNFTGQHRTFVKDTPTSQLDSKEGLIVSADQNEFVKMSDGVAYGNEAITINESLPLVSLSTKSNDKKCFGVLSTTEDPETRKEVYGNFASTMRKEEGDTRVYVNSVGEGAIWVTDTNGTLESGDYITTSNVAGYGMKQDDDILHNYTVAKILMDCDFNPVTQPKRIIRKESRMIDYWIRYGDVKITEEEYHTLPETKRKIVEDVHYRIDQMEVVKEDPEKDTFVYEQREEMVNVLNEHGEFQWEETDETEKAYTLRYLDADGNIVDEANAVHIAAFVGCTYHCG